MSARYLRAALRLSLFIFLPLSLAPSSCEARVWTNDQGQTIEAEFVRVSGRMAMLKQGDKTVKAPIARLSDTDQDWIKRFKKIDKVREWGPDAVRGRYDKLSDSEVRVRFGGDSAKIPISNLTDEDIAHLVERYGMLEQELPAEIAARRPEGAPALEGSSAPRDWTDLNGRTITAQFVRLEGNAVVIFRKGREFKVPLSKLSEEDQLWAASQAASANQFASAIQPTNAQPYDLAGPPDEGRGDRLPNNQQSAMQQAMAEQSKQIAFGVLGTVFRTVKYRDDREGKNADRREGTNLRVEQNSTGDQASGHWSNIRDSDRPRFAEPRVVEPPSTQPYQHASHPTASDAQARMAEMRAEMEARRAEALARHQAMIAQNNTMNAQARNDTIVSQPRTTTRPTNRPLTTNRVAKVEDEDDDGPSISGRQIRRLIVTIVAIAGAVWRFTSSSGN